MDRSSVHPLCIRLRVREHHPLGNLPITSGSLLGRKMLLLDKPYLALEAGMLFVVHEVQPPPTHQLVRTGFEIVGLLAQMVKIGAERTATPILPDRTFSVPEIAALAAAPLFATLRGRSLLDSLSTAFVHQARCLYGVFADP